MADDLESVRSVAVCRSPRRRNPSANVGGGDGRNEGIVGLQGMRGDVQVPDAGIRRQHRRDRRELSERPSALLQVVRHGARPAGVPSKTASAAAASSTAP